MDVVDFDQIFLNDRQCIGNLLIEDNHYDNLIGKLKQFEVCHGHVDDGIFNTRTPTKPYTFYELPTHELLCAIWNICKYFDANSVLEVAAGCGLVSYVANSYINKTGITFCPSDNNSWLLNSKDSKYGYVEHLSFDNIVSSNPILICWLHHDCQAQFINMIKRNQPPFIIHVGEGPGGCCYDSNFLNIMLSMGYEYQLIPVKTIAKTDYFQHDTIRNNTHYSYSRTCITLLYPKQYSNVNFTTIVGEHNLHTYKPCDEQYAKQDKSRLQSQSWLDKYLDLHWLHQIGNEREQLYRYGHMHPPTNISQLITSRFIGSNCGLQNHDYTPPITQFGNNQLWIEHSNPCVTQDYNLPTVVNAGSHALMSTSTCQQDVDLCYSTLAALYMNTGNSLLSPTDTSFVDMFNDIYTHQLQLQTQLQLQKQKRVHDEFVDVNLDCSDGTQHTIRLLQLPDKVANLEQHINIDNYEHIMKYLISVKINRPKIHLLTATNIDTTKDISDLFALLQPVTMN